jgi:MFS/sugar transport protein
VQSAPRFPPPHPGESVNSEGTVMATRTPITTSAARPLPTATKTLRPTQYLGYASGGRRGQPGVLNVPAPVGTMFLRVRFGDAVTDLFAGRLVDRAHTRWGKFRPFILFGAAPLLLRSVAVFSVPPLGGLW